MIANVPRRRRGPDTLIRWINYLSTTAWIVIMVILIIVSMTKPGSTINYFGRNVQLYSRGDSSLMDWVLYLLIFLFSICSIGLMINSLRHRRKEDKYNRTLIVFGIGSILGIIIYIISRAG